MLGYQPEGAKRPSTFEPKLEVTIEVKGEGDFFDQIRNDGD
jgi:hypothetical protein